MKDVKGEIQSFSIGFSHLVVTTPGNIYVYNVKTWNTPIMLDINKGVRIAFVSQTHGYFMTVDSVSSAIQVYSYEGRMVSSPKNSSIITGTLRPREVAISPEFIVIFQDQGSLMEILSVKATCSSLHV